MINQQTIQGNWNEIKGKLLSKWGSLTDDDLAVFNGTVDQLVGTIQRITGEARENIEHFLDQLTSDGAAAIRQTSETVRTGAHTAADSVRLSSQRATEAVREGYADAEDMVRQRPGMSLAVCFGVGLVAGLVVSEILRRR